MAETEVSRPLTVLETGRLKYERAPAEGPKVLFLHGANGGSWYWHGFMRKFAARGYDAYAMNLRGHGLNGRLVDLSGVGIWDYLDDLRTVADALQPDVLIAHSMGGLLGLKLAEERSLGALILASSAPPRGLAFAASHPLKMVWHLLPVLPSLLRGRPMEATWGMLRAFSLNNLPETEARDAAKFFGPESPRVGIEVGVKRIVSVEPTRIRCPTLVLGAERDAIVSVKTSSSLARFLKTELLVLEGAAHMFPIEAGWEGYADQILRWLVRAVPPGKSE